MGKTSVDEYFDYSIAAGIRTTFPGFVDDSRFLSEYIRDDAVTVSAC
jgi:hypothetical protein